MALPANPLAQPFAACSGEHWEKALAAILEDQDSMLEIAMALEYNVERALGMALRRLGASTQAYSKEMAGLTVAEVIGAPEALSESERLSKVLAGAHLAREMAVASLALAVVMSTLEEWSTK